jgi:hypothetical protein
MGEFLLCIYEVMSIQTAQGIILFGAENVDNRTVSHSLSDLGISLLRLSTYDCSVMAIPEMNQYRYGLYKSNLPAFMEALDGEYHHLTTPFYPITSDDEVLEGFTLPSMIFGFEARMSDEVRQDILARTGSQSLREIVRGGGKISYIIDSVPLANLAYIAALPGINHITPAYDNTSNLAALPDYTLALRIARKFITLHSYPAFMDADHMQSLQSNFIENDDFEKSDKALNDSIDRPIGGQILESELKEVNDWMGRTSRSGAVAPPQKGGDILFREVNEIDLGGYYAPFILDLAQYDTQTVPKVIQRHFAGCLGDDNVEAADGLRLLKSSFGILGKTDQGKALAHLFKCIDIAVEGQLSIRIFSDETIGYKGCALLGYGTHLEVERRVISWAPRDTLRNSIARADYHTRAISTISGCLGLNALDTVTLASCTTFSRMKALLGLHPTTSAQRQTILQAASHLRLPQQHWRVNVESFQRLFHYLNISDPLPDDLPIHPSKLFEEKRLDILLSCFGDFAPSFKVPGGREMNLETAQSKLQTMREGQKVVEIKNVTRIGCRSMPLDVAISDWEWVRENQKIYNPFAQPKVKSSAEYFTRFFEGQNMQVILEGLRKYCNVMIAVGAGPSGKRKATEATEDAGSSKKKRRGFF